MTLRVHAVLLTLIAPMIGADAVPAAGEQVVRQSADLVYRVTAQGARVNRKVIEEAPVEFVQGVPARPVDSFVWNGVGSTPIDGQITIELDPVSNTGLVVAEWTDEHGDWALTWSEFQHPHHAGGIRIGPSRSGEIEEVLKDAVVTNAYLHGDTGAGAPILPTVFSHLSAWGPAFVTLNGEVFAQNYDYIPKPFWKAHLMVTVGVREPDGTVRNEDDSYFSMATAGRGKTDPHDLEVHLVFHDEWYPEVLNNIPFLFQFFYHLVFEDVVLQIVQTDDPLRAGR